MRSITRILASGAIGIASVLGVGFAISPANASDQIAIFGGCEEKNGVLPVGVTAVMQLPVGCDYEDFWGSGATIVYDSGRRELHIVLTDADSGGIILRLRNDPGEYGIWGNGLYLKPCGSEIGTAAWPFVEYCASGVTAQATGYGEQAPRPPIEQGLPMPATGSCADVQDADFAWGTGLTGGWRKSWQPWVRSMDSSEVNGGWACIRTLVNMGGTTWVIEN